MPRLFHDFDLSHFWKDSDYSRENYVEAEPTAKIIATVEKELGVKLPPSYLELMQVQNGGIPRNGCFPTKVATSWAENHVAISGIFGIGRKKTYSLCGSLGSKFMQEEWGYPDIGICICNCPSAGHDMIMLDYRKCGKAGEPEVVHVDQESDYEITFLANNFEAFIRGLVNKSVYDTSAEDLKKALEVIENGSFSSLLTGLIADCGERNFGPIIRNVCRKLTNSKGYFALHADELSHLVYDIQFYLYSMSKPVKTDAAFLKDYSNMIAFGDGQFTTGGYGPGFVEDWIAKRKSEGEIITTRKGSLAFSDQYCPAFKAKLSEFE